MRDIAAFIVGIGLLLSIGFAFTSQPVMPECSEDEPVLVGLGNFEDGRWDRYQCVHVDDMNALVDYVN